MSPGCIIKEVSNLGIGMCCTHDLVDETDGHVTHMWYFGASNGS